MIKKTYFVSDDGTFFLPENSSEHYCVAFCGDAKTAFERCHDADLRHRYHQQTGHDLGRDCDTISLSEVDESLRAEAEQARARIEKFKEDNANYYAHIR